MARMQPNDDELLRHLQRHMCFSLVGGIAIDQPCIYCTRVYTRASGAAWFLVRTLGLHCVAFSSQS